MPIIKSTGKIVGAPSAAPAKEGRPVYFSGRLAGDGSVAGPFDRSGDPALKTLWNADWMRPPEQRVEVNTGPVKCIVTPLLPVPAADFLENGDWTRELPLDEGHGQELWRDGGERAVAWLVPLGISLKEEGTKSRDPKRNTYHASIDAPYAFVARTLDAATGEVLGQAMIGPNGDGGLGGMGEAAKKWVSDHAPAGTEARAVATWGAYVHSFSLWHAVAHAAWRMAEELREWAGPYMRRCASTGALGSLGKWLHLLESFRVSLEDVLWMEGELSCMLPAADVDRLSGSNLELYLARCMGQLEGAKASMPAPVDPSTPLPARPWPWSAEQAACVTSPGPCTLVAAGAGTGKSTTIMGRVEWMIAGGTAPEDIYVLSFTNAAADHIKELDPSIKSTTSSSMVHGIYRANHPTHRLSDSPLSLVNVLRYRHRTDPVAMELASLLLAQEKHDGKNVERSKVTELRQFVARHHDHVVEILDRLRTTTLDLEIVMCDLGLERMDIPDEFKAPHYIVDETQDDSILDFCFTLHLAALLGSDLYIVGDAAQTLYEFRGADPEALCALEGSGCFSPRRLTVNHRSNQAVLDMANEGLSQIRANRYAQISLKSASVTPMTSDERARAVQALHVEVGNDPKERLENLSKALEQDGGWEWLDERVRAGEQVCAMVQSNDAADQVFGLIDAHYGGKVAVARLSRKQARSSDVMTKWLLNGFDKDVEEAAPKGGSLSFHLTQALIAALPRLDRGAKRALADKRPLPSRLTDAVDAWGRDFGAKVDAAGQLFSMGAITAEELSRAVSDTVIESECRQNHEAALRDHDERRRMKEEASSGAAVCVSTIHGTKGLEFDHTMVFVPRGMCDVESDKRLAYVALTRAKKSELVVTWPQGRSDDLSEEVDARIEGVLACA